MLVSQDRSDEFDYSKSLEGQQEVSFDNHWRKHTMSFEMDGKVSILFPITDFYYSVPVSLRLNYMLPFRST